MNIQVSAQFYQKNKAKIKKSPMKDTKIFLKNKKQKRRIW